MTWRFPWPEPISVYDSRGPREEGAIEFEIDGARFRVGVTGDLGVSTMRDRYRVECLTCAIVIHENTTGPDVRVEQHLGEAHR